MQGLFNFGIFWHHTRSRAWAAGRAGQDWAAYLPFRSGTTTGDSGEDWPSPGRQDASTGLSDEP